MLRIKKRRLLPVIVLLCIVCVSGIALAATLGDELHAAGTEIAEGTRLAYGVYWNTAYSDRLTENYIEYRPSTAVTPVVVYGSKLLNYGNFKSMAALLENRGRHVIGGINGDFYDTANFMPLGIVITDGILRSSEGVFNAVGFRADGTAIISKPGLQLTANIKGQEFPINFVNKIRAGGVITLFTEDFAATTRNTLPGYDVVFSIKDGGALRINSTVTLTVDSVHESKGALDIPAGKMVMSLVSDGDEWRMSGLRSLSPGDEVTVRCTAADTRWNEVVNAIGCFQKLVTGGLAESGLDNVKNPRSAIGIRGDGSVILYTIDGRQPGYSAGVSTTQVAQRLIELGCVDAGLLDGGGSTSLNALYIGDESISQINSPSDGTQRSVTDYIMLVTSGGANGIPARLGVYPYDSVLLAGAQQSFSIKAADSAGYPASVPPALTYATQNGLGSVTDTGVFTAGSTAGQETVIVTGGAAAGFATVTIIDTPHDFTVYNEYDWSKVSSLNLTGGSVVNLSATAVYNGMTLKSDDSCYKWEAVGGIGTIDALGRFTAVPYAATGSIRVSAGTKTVTIPVTVNWKNPFNDVAEGAWYYGYVSYTSATGLLKGVSPVSFDPDGSCSRAMLATVLGRHAQISADDFPLPVFPDTPEGEWYTPYTAWAAENGVAIGDENGLFNPDQALTREQLCIMLVRYAEYRGVVLPETTGASDFIDASAIHEYARDAVEQCYRAGIVQGKSGGIFDPAGTASRAELAAVLKRFVSFCDL